MFGFGAPAAGPTTFDEHYRCYPVSFADKAHLEDGDKILLPPSALDTLARLHIDYPMLFQLENESTGRKTHCGVMEFSAQEGSCYLPYWMMQNLFISEGSLLRVKSATLLKATFVKIRPQSIEFLNITNPRAVLEASLRKFSCMTVGDTICLSYNSKKFFLDVREVRPADAACIIETDCEVDFEAPADYVPPGASKSAAAASSSDKVTVPYGGIPTYSKPTAASTSTASGGRTLGGGLRLNSKSSVSTTAGGKTTTTDSMAAMRDARMRKYETFHGTGQSLDGTVKSAAAPLCSSIVKKEAATEEKEEAKPPAAEPFSGAGRRLR